MNREESKGVQGSQRKENRFRQSHTGGAAEAGRLRLEHYPRQGPGTDVETTGRGRKSLEMRSQSIAEDIAIYLSQNRHAGDYKLPGHQ